MGEKCTRHAAANFGWIRFESFVSGGSPLIDKLTLLEILLAGFFAIACFRARPSLREGEKVTLGKLFRLSGRIERLRRSRWQWFSMVAIMLWLRLQHQLPPAIEVMVGLMFLLFLVFPVQQLVKVSR
jgi:hypothetical protein